MKLTFKLNSEQEIIILGDGKIIGSIFTPAGTSHDRTNAIQICGFENAFDLWGCGVFKDNEAENPRKDIQLLFNKETKMGGTKHLELGLNKLCHKCYYPKDKCMCKDLRIKTIDELTLERLEKND